MRGLRQLLRPRNVCGVTASLPRPARRHAGTLLLALSIALSIAACSPGPTKPESSANGSPGAPRRPVVDHATRQTPPPTVTGSPSSTANLAELTDMCRSLHDDYGDGTLSDFFSELEITSRWGKDLAARARASITPGRVLAAHAPSNSALPPECQRLFEELDDLE